MDTDRRNCFGFCVPGLLFFKTTLVHTQSWVFTKPNSNTKPPLGLALALVTVSNSFILQSVLLSLLPYSFISLIMPQNTPEKGGGGRSTGNQFTLNRQRDLKGADGVQMDLGLLCVPIGTEFKCEACWEVAKNLPDHWRDSCLDAAAYNRLRNMFRAHGEDFDIAWYRKIASHPNGVIAKVILHQDPLTWTPFKKLVGFDDSDRSHWVGKTYAAIAWSILDAADYEMTQQVKSITNYHHGAAAKSKYTQEDYNKFLVDEFKALKDHPLIQESVGKAFMENGFLEEFAAELIKAAGFRPPEGGMANTSEVIKGIISPHMKEAIAAAHTAVNSRVQAAKKRPWWAVEAEKAVAATPAAAPPA